MRLQKYLAASGVASRRASESMIAEGRITVNGEIAALGQSVEPETDRVEVDGKLIEKEAKVYLVFNKPENVVTTAKDTHGRKTVLDFMHDVGARVYPIGRLDMDVSGVLLLTNDGELSNRLMHPSYEMEKLYEVSVAGDIKREALQQLEQGVELEDGKTAPAKVVVLKATRTGSRIRLTLHEGKKREVKRMCAAVGHRVRKLRRISFAGIRVNNFAAGQWRHLSNNEVKQLKKMVGLD